MKRPVTILLLAVSTLLLLGTVTLFSATTYQLRLDRVWLHLGWVALGGIGCVGLSLADYRWIRRYHLAEWLLVCAGVMLLAVLVPGLGVTKNGAARWLWLGQPSEFAKFALIIFLAHYGASHQERMPERWTGFIYPGLLAGAILLLIFLEPDWGTAVLLAVVTLAMLAIAGTSWAYLLAAAVIGGQLFALLLLHNPLRLERFLAFRNPEQFASGVGWQGWHSLLSLGSGGWFGTFFGEGRHKNGFVPEQDTDFILSLLGEEMGLVGTGLVLVLFLVILFCGTRIAWGGSDPFGQLLASGITLLITLQALINIGVVTSSLPNKGIALPLVSYGGSSLVCTLCGLGILISIARRSPEPESRPRSNFPEAPAKLKPAGPVGSLLVPLRAQGTAGSWFGPLRWLRARRASRFPAVAKHAYQQLPDRS